MAGAQQLTRIELLRPNFVQTTFGYMINVLWVRKVISLWSLCSKQDIYGPAHSCSNYPLEFLSFSHWFQRQTKAMRLMSEVSWEEFRFSRACLFCFGKSLIWSAHHIHMYILIGTEGLIIMNVREHFLFDQQRKIKDRFSDLCWSYKFWVPSCGACLVSDHLIDFTFSSFIYWH